MTSDDDHDADGKPSRPFNPYADVDVIENALAFALRIPRFAPKAKSRRERPATPPEVGELTKYIDEHARKLLELGRKYARKGGATGLDFFFYGNVETWVGTANHFTERQTLVDELVAMRKAALDSLRALPEPNEKGQFHTYVLVGPAPVGPTWAGLDDTERRVLELLAKERLEAKQLAAKLKMTPSAVRHVTARLVRSRIIERTGKSGYVIKRAPRGAPEELVAAAEGRSAPSS